MLIIIMCRGGWMESLLSVCWELAAEHVNNTYKATTRMAALLLFMHGSDNGSTISLQ